MESAVTSEIAMCVYACYNNKGLTLVDFVIILLAISLFDIATSILRLCLCSVRLKYRLISNKYLDSRARRIDSSNLEKKCLMMQPCFALSTNEPLLNVSLGSPLIGSMHEF